MDTHANRREFVGSALALGVTPLSGGPLHRRFGLGPRVVEPVNEFYSGRNGDGTCNELVRTNDGGYAFTGKVGDGALWLVKVDAAGAKVWQRRFWADAASPVSGQALVETSDGGFLLAGEARSAADDEDDDEAVGTTTFAVKTGPDGEKRWRTRLEASGVPDDAVERVGSAVELDGGGYVVAGGRTVNESAQPVFTKLTADGDVAWRRVRTTDEYVQNSLLEPGSRSGVALLEATAEGFRAALLSGPRSDVASLQFVRFDADGTERTVEGFDPVPGGMSLPVALTRHPDGGYVMIVKLTTSTYGPHGLVSLTESLEIRWRQRLREVEGPRDVGVGDAGGIFVVGETRDGTWVSRYDATGSRRWVRTGYYGTSSGEFAGPIVRGDAAVVGATAESEALFGGPSAWLLQVAETDDERLKGVLGLAGVGLVWTVLAQVFGGGDDGD